MMFSKEQKDQKKLIKYNNIYYPKNESGHSGFSEKLLSFKLFDINRVSAIKIKDIDNFEYIYNIINNEFISDKNMAIIPFAKKHMVDAIGIVPSHHPDNKSNTMTLLAEIIARDNGWKNITYNIERFKKIEKKAFSHEERNCETDLNSIKIINPEKIKKKTILLMDDITTSGSSLIACKTLLLEAGASLVIMFALGKTRQNEKYK